MLDCARKTVAQHGPQGLYRGALPLILGSSGKQAARWTGYETAANAMKDFAPYWVKTMEIEKGQFFYPGVYKFAALVSSLYELIWI